ncbi:MAG: MBL fold metallo-hydrolase [Thermoanaerobaculia bacterium]|nr:MBL fold metallo-hydrolase [Thermoanaerobaculia bacterium]
MSRYDNAPPTYRLGELKLTLVSDGGFALDGGAMFGVVPKNLWSRKKPADEQNRIAMQTHCLLVERGDDLLLVDTGLGDHHDAKFRSIFALEEEARRLPDSIRAAGYELGDVTHVLSTHLHFDHCGWNCTGPDDSARPTFPNARYVMSRGEAEHARSPNDRDRASYNPRNWEPLFAAGQVDLFDEEAEPVPGVRAIEVKGHNANMCIVRLDGGGSETGDTQGIYWADLVPTVAHVSYPWIMGYDLYPLDTLAHKKEWLPKAYEGGWLCFFEHEDAEPVGRLERDERGRLSSRPVA